MIMPWIAVRPQIAEKHAICDVTKALNAVRSNRPLLRESADLDESVLGIDSWLLSPRRPTGSLQCDSDVYHSCSLDSNLLH